MSTTYEEESKERDLRDFNSDEEQDSSADDLVQTDLFSYDREDENSLFSLY